MIQKITELVDMRHIIPLFADWEETMIWSCIQGHMGYALTDGKEPPKAAQIVIGDFCFFAGIPDVDLIKAAGAILIIPQNEAWCSKIEEVLGDQVYKESRYSIKKEPDVFNRQKLMNFINFLPERYELKMIDKEIYDYLICHEWSGDFCSQFKDFEDFHNRGLGVVVLDAEIPVSGAASYTIYSEGIEIEIDTEEGYQGQGLATACGAKLILECLDRGLYPSWDAHDLRSVALAEKLGYHRNAEYPVYIRK